MNAARLILGDCLEVGAALPPASVDAIVPACAYQVGLRVAELARAGGRCGRRQA